MSFGIASYGADSYGLGANVGSAPLIYAWVPSVGLQIARLDWIGFTVASSRPLASVIVRVIYQSGITEPVYAEGAFSGLYWRGSAAIEIGAGLRFVCRRAGGWPAARFRLHVRAEDDLGRVSIGRGDYT